MDALFKKMATSSNNTELNEWVKTIPSIAQQFVTACMLFYTYIIFLIF